MELSRFKADELIQSTKGKIFSCTFSKKDGTIRKMIARLGVQKDLKDGNNGASYKNALITVYDMLNNGYRMINLSTLQCLKVHGTNYKII